MHVAARSRSRTGDRTEGVSRSRRIERIAKRGCDLVAAAVLLALFSPVLALAALAIVLEDGRPVLFIQRRVGLRGRPFRVAKLRTLKVNDLDPEVLGEVRARHPLALRSGAVLRRFKVDELPQLWNVLVGDMSLVGPRPTLPQQTDAYDAFQRRRLEVRPGLSGWSQVNGNVELTWEERILLDVWYVDHWSLSLDARILLATASVVLFGEKRAPAALERAIRHANRTGRSG
jgi:lipopolysaccharide/colanic/teichoic acid biosynthesis glycosyltransferase